MNTQGFEIVDLLGMPRALDRVDSGYTYAELLPDKYKPGFAFYQVSKFLHILDAGFACDTICSMIEQNPVEEILAIIKEIETDPSATQRDLSQKVGISLGKTNYLLKELIKKGFIKVCHFSTHGNKLRKVTYILTRKGLNRTIHLLRHFLKLKEEEYNVLQKEWLSLKQNSRKR